MQVEPPSSVSELPESRQAAWAQSMAMYQETAAQLDTMRVEVAKLKSDIAGYKVALEAKDSVMLDLESRIQTMQMVRDEPEAHAEQRQRLRDHVGRRSPRSAPGSRRRVAGIALRPAGDCASDSPQDHPRPSDADTKGHAGWAVLRGRRAGDVRANP